MFSLFRDHGILGINARNLLYLRPYNPKKAISLADDKIKTKHFLEARGIPVPKLLYRIRHEEDLERFDWHALPDEFVVKPNTGFGGEGILVLAGKKKHNYLKINGEQISIEEIASHVDTILSGKFSMSRGRDTVLFEQRLISHPIFKRFTDCGLPDVRVVVHNLIPIMAMLRVPTKESDGKANVHLGGIGIGIDISKGVTTHAVQYNKIIKEIPRFGNAMGVQIPYWDDILLIASKIQKITNLGYLACDIVIDKNAGPVLLEINARGGLMVQLANLAPLRKRLERIEGIKVSSPEKGVRIGQDIFGEKIIEKDESAATKKTVIGIQESINIHMSKGTKSILAKIDYNLEKSLFTNTVIDELKEAGAIEEMEGDTYKVKFELAGRKLQTLVSATNLFDKEYDAIIGRRDLKEFLIDPNKEISSQQLKEKKGKTNAKIDYHSIDERLCEMDRKTKLIYHLRPINIGEEEQKFSHRNGEYNPVFLYPEIEFDANDLRDRLQYIKTDNSPLGKIFDNKKREILGKIDLLSARGNEELFTQKSIELYFRPTIDIFNKAEKEIETISFDKYEDSDIEVAEVKERFEKVFKKYDLEDWKVTLKDDMVADCSVNKRGRLFLKSGVKFSEKRIENLILHEIETHILTAENGKYQPYEIFRQGTANYLTTQEGLAIYNQETFKTDDSVGARGIHSFLAVYWALHYSFSEVCERLRAVGLSEERAFQTALKVKRGLSDTVAPGAFTKNCVYYLGYLRIQEFAQNGGDLKSLYIGKISLEELDIYKQIKEIKRPTYLPDFLKEKK